MVINVMEVNVSCFLIDVDHFLIFFHISQIHLKQHIEKPHMNDAEGVTDCLDDLGETSAICCLLFKDVMHHEHDEL